MQGDYILSVYFHKPSKKEFESCIKWFVKNRFTFIKASDLESIILNKSPFPKGAVLITVDDGWQSNVSNIAEIANGYGVPVTIFVSTDPVETGNFWWSYVIEAKKRKISKFNLEYLKRLPNEERLLTVEVLKTYIKLPREALTIEQVKEISESEFITIGCHTVSHPILINCSDEQAYAELEQSKEKLESWTASSIQLFSYPNGDYYSRETQILNQLHYKMAFTTKPLYLTPNMLKKYELPRFEVREGVSFAENICRMVGVWQPLINSLKKFKSKLF